MERRFVRPMTVARLTALLDEGKDGGDGVLVIDARSFLSFFAGHISTAHSVHCPSIVLRRRRGGGPTTRVIPLEDVVRCAPTRDRLLAGGYGAVVAYDDRTDGGQGNAAAAGLALKEDSADRLANDVAPVESASSNLRLVLESLLNHLPHNVHECVFFLDGGFESFAREAGRLVVTEISLSSSSSSSSSSVSPSSSTSSSRKRTFDMTSFANSSTGVSHSSICDREILNTIDTIIVKPLKASDTASKWHFAQDRGDPAEILPWLYLGNAYHSVQENRLRRLGIGALLNVAETTVGRVAVAAAAAAADALPTDAFCQMNLPIADSATSDISSVFPQAIEFIENVRLSGGKVLVHCLAGVSRSPAVCMAYLMYALRLSLDDAHDFLKAKRHLISPNLNFMRQLAEYEAVVTVHRQRDARRCPLASLTTSSSSSSVSGIVQTAVAGRGVGGGEGTVGTPAVERPCSRKRTRRPDSLSFAVMMTSSSTVPMTPCTKQAGSFGFDFSSAAVGMKMSPTLSQNPLLSPI